MAFIFLSGALLNKVQHVQSQLREKLLEAGLLPLEGVVVLVGRQVEQGRNGVRDGDGLKCKQARKRAKVEALEGE